METTLMKRSSTNGPFFQPAVDAVAPVGPEDLSRFEGEGGREAPILDLVDQDVLTVGLNSAISSTLPRFIIATKNSWIARGRSPPQSRIHGTWKAGRFRCSAGRCDWRRVERELLHRPMNILKHICLTIIELAKRAWFLPQSIANAVQQRRRQAALNELEAERLDRIRNPSKYRGKEI